VLARVPLLVAASAKGHRHKRARDATVVASHTVAELDLVGRVPPVAEGAEWAFVLVLHLLHLLHWLHLLLKTDRCKCRFLLSSLRQMFLAPL
jgi:hypothetical protein